jgi:hypothetical protein
VSFRVSWATLLIAAPLILADCAKTTCGAASNENAAAAMNEEPRNFRNGRESTIAGVIETPG